MVERIRNLVQNQSFVTGVYGHQNDLFVENDLQRYNLNQQLYRCFKQAGFDRIVFFDMNQSFTSYDTESLTQLINSEVARQQQAERPTSNAAYHEQDKRAQGGKRLLGRRQAATPPPTPPSEASGAAAQPSGNPLIQSLGEGRNRQYQWQVPQQSVQFDKIREFLEHTRNRGCMIFRVTAQMQLGNFAGQLFACFAQIEQDRFLKDNQNRLYLCYEGTTDADFINHLSGAGHFFGDVFFRNRFLLQDGERLSVNAANTFRIALPDETELRAALNRQRLNGQLTWQWSHTSILLKSLFRDGYTCNQVMSMTQQALERFQKLDVKPAWERLNEMIGLAAVKKAIEKQLIMARSPKKLKNMRRHLVFTGNPGTGKTTVARLVAEIYKENNILSRGQLVEGDRETLVAGYVGQSAIKTKAACERALGGVLFVDEAYNLKKNNDSDAFGDEAITTLLKSMEDNQDNLVVITAGYTEEMQTFLDANPGLRSRFANGFIEFEDYSPVELLQIFVKKALSRQVNVTDILPLCKRILEKLYLKRDKNFGNARVVENLMDGIVENHTYRCELDKLDVYTAPAIPADIPPNYTAADNQANKTVAELDAAMKELTDMIGLQSVKETVQSYARSIKVQQRRNIVLSNTKKLTYSMNFVFSGNPGTGKTTVARLLGQILKGLGLLETDTLIEVNRDKLVAGYVGQTAIKTREVIESALGGVLFIDEAYSLANKGDTDFGHEAIETILAAMTDPRYQGKMAFVVAGYPADMDIFIQSNAGLQRRFNNFVLFENYSSEELVRIFEMKVTKQSLRLRLGVKSKAFQYFEQLTRNRTFGNAGEAEKLVAIACSELDKRAERYDYETAEDLLTIIPEDIPPFGQPAFALRDDLENRVTNSVPVTHNNEPAPENPNSGDNETVNNEPALENPNLGGNGTINPEPTPENPNLGSNGTINPEPTPENPNLGGNGTVNPEPTPENPNSADDEMNNNEPTSENPNSAGDETTNNEPTPENPNLGSDETNNNEPTSENEDTRRKRVRNRRKTESPMPPQTLIPIVLPDTPEFNVLIEPLMYDICLIDTNIWLDTRPKTSNANRMSVETISKIYHATNKKITILDACYDEIEKKASLRNTPENADLRYAAKQAIRLIERLQNFNTIDIPDVKAYFRDAYADPDCIEYLKEMAKANQSILFICQDRALRTRVIAALNNLRKTQPNTKFLVWDGASMCEQSIKIAQYLKNR